MSDIGTARHQQIRCAALCQEHHAARPIAQPQLRRLGRQTQRLDLTPRQRFDAATAVSGYVVGTAADLGQEPPADVVEGRATREEALDRLAEGWRSLDPEEFPFLHEVVEEFHDHDDREQFLAGLDLLLAGLRLHAER